MAGTLTVSGLAAGLLTGEKVIQDLTMTGTGVIGEIEDATLASGDNTFAVPSGAIAVLIVMGGSDSAELKLRTNLNSGDAGTPFGPLGYLVWSLYTGTTSLIINAASSGGTIELTFI